MTSFLPQSRIARLFTLTTSLGAVALVGIGTGVLAQSGKPAAKPSVTVYKSPTCGCCSQWITHMRANGYTVTAVDVDDVEVPMKTYGVPASAGSCHTALVGGYVVEGHVPADLVTKMLTEKPAIAGLSAPGMPAGSPGMEVPGYKGSYNIVSFDKTGKTALYAKRVVTQ